MSTKKGTGHGVDHHNSNYGNMHIATMSHVFTAADLDGDVIRMGRMSSAHTYTSVVVARSGALGPATIDVGIVNKEDGSETPDFFKAGVASASAGRSEALTLPVSVDDHHEVIVTLNGADATVGAELVLIMTGRHDGA